MDDSTTLNAQGPPEKRRPRRWERAYLRAFARTGNRTVSARFAKVDRTESWRQERDCPEFAALCKQAHDEYVETLEREADRRGIRGYLVPVFHQGKRCGEKLRFSDALLMFRPKGLRPDRYRESADRDAATGDVVFRDVDW